MKIKMEYFEKINFCVVWTQPSSVIPEFSDIIDMKNISIKELFNSVDYYTNLLKNTAKKIGILIVPISSDSVTYKFVKTLIKV